MKNKRFALLAMLVGVVLSSACGAPGEYDLCNQTCDAVKNCSYSSSTDYQNCRNDCETHKGGYGDQTMMLEKSCKNANDILNKASQCISATACGASLASFIATATACVTQAASSCIAQ